MLSSNSSELFLKLQGKYNQSAFLLSDPVQFVHRYKNKRDQEVVAFLSACFAYGSVQLIHQAIEKILAPMGRSPFDFISKYKGRHCWPNFYYRFHQEAHLETLVALMSVLIKEYGSLECFFKSNEMTSEHRVAGILNGASFWLKKNVKNFFDKESKYLRGMLFFFNSPSDGSACKRLNMFLRWMSRKDKIDLGLWKWLNPKDLVIPVDTHIARLSYYLNLRTGNELKSPNWKMAIEITQNLKKLDPSDPVGYDFALTRLGILDICKRKYEKSICEECPVQRGCRFNI